MPFSPAFRDWLHQQGVDDDRRVDPERYAKHLAGYKVADAAPVVDAVARFAGVQLTHDGASGPFVALDLDPDRAHARVHRGALTAFRRRLGHPLFPFGHAANGNMLVYLAPSGTVYASHELTLYRVSDDLEEAIEILVQRRASLEPLLTV